MDKQRHKPRTWGFQFLRTDAVAICIFLGVAAGFWRMGSPLSWLLLMAAGHFFLFCNVFRIVRKRELIWAGLFLLNVCVWAWFDRLTWSAVLLSQIPITVALVVADMRTPTYHGVFARRLNSYLDAYLEGKTF